MIYKAIEKKNSADIDINDDDTLSLNDNDNISNPINHPVFTPS